MLLLLTTEKLDHITCMKKLYAIGLNYKKADARIRGLFSTTESVQAVIIQEAKAMGIPSLTILSTCNRTELYGFADHPFQIIKLLCNHTNGSLEMFEKVAYVYKEQEAVAHLFRVGTGLDSQILGDFEIISQLRKSFKLSKEKSMLNSYMERLINSVIQASKRIKTETSISTGATSVSYAAVQYIQNRLADVFNKNLLLFGTGEIGRNTIENLIKHTGHKHITLINRTKVNAEAIAGKYDLIVKDYENIATESSRADVLIVATAATNPTITKATLTQVTKPLLVIDLSIPQNVSEDVDELEMVHRVHLDELVKITEETRNERALQIPYALELIEEVELEFLEWVESRRFAPTIRALKEKLTQIKENEIANQNKKQTDFNGEQAKILGDRIVQKITTQFASHLRNDQAAMQENLDLITQVFQLDQNIKA